MGDNRLVHNVKWVNSIYALVRISFGESCSLETLPIDRSVHLQCPRDVGRVTSIKTGLSVNRIAFNICKYPSTILPQPRPNTTLLEDANELLNYTIPNFVEPSLMLCQRWLNFEILTILPSNIWAYFVSHIAFNNLCLSAYCIAFKINMQEICRVFRLHSVT